MSDGTHAQRIIALVTARPGLDDDEIASALGIQPRQTVNQNCRRLAMSGMLRRQRGPSGKIVNVVGEEVPPTLLRTDARVLRSESGKARGGRAVFQGPLIPGELATTLLVIPCSGAKREYDAAGADGPAITQSLAAPLVAELLEARRRVKQRVPFDESTLVPAWQRYCGALYEAGRDALADIMDAGSHVVILSGGYGALPAREAIGLYDARLNPAWWPGQILQCVLMAYARRHGIRAVRAFVSATGPYISILRRTPWREAGIEDVLLLTPQREPGAMRRSPATQGEALLALRDGTLTRDWRSSYGLRLDIHST